MSKGLFSRRVNNNRTGRLNRHLDPASIYQNIVRKYGLETGLSAEYGLCVHSLRATAATNALSHDSDIAKVQEWLGHAIWPGLVRDDGSLPRKDTSPCALMSKSIVNVSVALSWGTLPLPQAGQPEWLSIPHHDPVRLLRRTRPFRDAFRRRQGQYHHSHRSIFVRRFIFELAGRIIRFIEDNWNLGRIGNSSFDALAGSLLKMFDSDHESQEKRLFLDPNTGEPCRF